MNLPFWITDSCAKWGQCYIPQLVLVGRLTEILWALPSSLSNVKLILDHRCTSPGPLLFATKWFLRTELNWTCVSFRFLFCYPSAYICLHYCRISNAPCQRNSVVSKSLYCDQNSPSHCNLDSHLGRPGWMIKSSNYFPIKERYSITFKVSKNWARQLWL